MVTYSMINYGSNQNPPQIISAIDETNLALKQVLGFTVGYYGSVLQVTGNSSYAYNQAQGYLNSGLTNVVDINPTWGLSFSGTNLTLTTNWFTNASYSEGDLNVTYDLTGLGVYGIAYSVSCRLDVQISPSTSNNQVCLTVIQDGTEPLVGLGMSNFKFYQYQDSNLTWDMVNPPDEPISSSNGEYTIDIPSGINPQSYIIQVQDSRGIIVSASSFDYYTGSLTFNSTVVSGGDYVNLDNSSVDGVADIGSHSNFAAQQQGPDGVFDTITEQAVSTQTQDGTLTAYSPQGGASLISGSLSNAQNDDGSYMTFQSYASAYSSTQYSTTMYDNANSTSTSGASSITWKHTIGTENDRILLISVDTFNTNNAPATVKSVYYGPTQITSNYTDLYSTNPQVRSYVFYLVNPLPGTNAVTVNFASSTAAIGGSTSYYNVNQTSPIITYNNTATGDSSSQSISLSASGNYNKVLFGSIAAQKSSSYTLYDQQNSRWSITGSYGSTYYYAERGSDKSVTSGTVTLNWNSSTHSVDWAAIAVLLQPTQLPTQQTCQVIFSGSSNLLNWNNVTWGVDASSNSSTTETLELFNYNANQYPTSGMGYQTGTLTTANSTLTQTIPTNPAYYNDTLGDWKLSFNATAASASPFTVNLDLVRYRTVESIYDMYLEEQWTNLNDTTLLHPTLCIDTGTMSQDNLALDAWHGGTWQPLSLSLVSGWNNISVNSYLNTNATTFTIRLRSNDTGDTVQSSWQIDAALLRPESNQDLFLALQNPAATVAVELLQNGTLVWLGQNLQLTSQAVPVPPVPVKAIHVNETIDGVNQQVPFQIEDWSSSYTIPLGLTNNATVFGNRQMIVFLVNTQVTAFTLWWNGSDQAIQTPLAYTNTYFTGDNVKGNTLSNGQLNLQFSGSGSTPFVVTSTVAGNDISSTATFMQINNQSSSCGSADTNVAADYVIYNGVVRDIVQQEAEWGGGGVSNCPNLYDDIVLTLPANATYYTYQLSLMFINSNQTRTITNLCPIQVNSTIAQLYTENGTLQADPVVAAGTQTFNSTGTWIHHWSEFYNGLQGAGIMFTDQANQMLYTFDSMTPAIDRGALCANSTSQTILLLPVVLNNVTFENPIDVTWCGALATFDASSVPIYSSYQPGLWILAELPPTISISTGD